MDRDTKIEDLKQVIRDFCEERDWGQFHSIKDLAIGAVTESAELLEIFRFQSETQIKDLLQNPQSRQDISDELADVFFFVLRIAQKYDFDLATAFAQKMERNRKKYPIEKARGQNTKYNKYES
jgi:NTP pyrophosphatase (non-canonical NTP hydrolase)